MANDLNSKKDIKSDAPTTSEDKSSKPNSPSSFGESVSSDGISESASSRHASSPSSFADFSSDEDLRTASDGHSSFGPNDCLTLPDRTGSTTSSPDRSFSDGSETTGDPSSPGSLETPTSNR